MKQTDFNVDDVEIIAEKDLYHGFFSLRQYRLRHRLYSGQWSAEMTREVFERGHAVVVLPYDPVRDQVVLIEQFRFPACDTTAHPWLLELVAGMIEPGESLSQVAERELEEESGLKALSLHPVSSYLASPGGSTERFHFFWAEVDASQAKGIHGLEQEHEDIRVVVVNREEAYHLLQQGRIDNAAAVMGLQWLQLNYQQLLVKQGEEHS